MKKIIVHLFDVNEIDILRLSSSIFINENDIENANKYRFELDRKERLASSYFKNKYVGEYHVDKNGKPVSDKCFFNISHSKGVVVFVMDEKSPIGVDVEMIKPVEEDFKKYVCSMEEYNRIKNDEDFFKIWTNKESLVKAFGTGINKKVNNILGLPLNGQRIYQEKIYQSRILSYNNYIIAVSLETNQDFEIEIIKEKL